MNTAIRTYKRKLILNKAQTERIEQWIGVCRMVYNMGKEIKDTGYKTNGEYVSEYELHAQLKDIRKDFGWVKDVPYQSMAVALSQLEKAYKSFFKGGGFPKFAKKDSYKSVGFKTGISAIGNKINLPKIGELKIFKDTAIIGDIRTARIIKESSGYFINITCAIAPIEAVSENQAIGLDMGIAHFYTDSNGNMVANPRHFKKYKRKLRVEMRSLARKKKGGNSRKKQAAKVARIYEKIRNTRLDFLHKESSKLAKENSVVILENLNIKGMSKSSLSAHIMDAGWGIFKELLAYKTEIISVDPKYTSQTCNDCGEIDKKSRVSQSQFICTGCGSVSHADINAAKNIYSRGAAILRERKAIGLSVGENNPKGITSVSIAVEALSISSNTPLKQVEK